MTDLIKYLTVFYFFMATASCGNASDAVDAQNAGLPPSVYDSKAGDYANYLREWLKTDQPLQVAEPKRLSFEPEMVQITGGTFMMGSPVGEGASDEHPQHEVTVGDFAMGKYEVTQGEWRAVMGSNPAHFSSCGERCPVEQVSWDDVQEYIAKLNAKTGKTYRLPTEAEWEYACRGGATGETYCGGNDIDSLAWYDGNSGSKTHSVGGKAANGFGLFDMSGNVWEWTCSQYDSNGYSGKEATCANQGNSGARAVRGGSWFNVPYGVRAAYRGGITPSNRGNDLGFRLIQD